MSGPTRDIDFSGTQKMAANLIASAFCHGGTEAFLDAQADLLKGVETAMTEWVHRRQEAIEEAYRLMTRLRDSRDVNDIWNAQQEWATGAWQRLAADVATYPALFANAGQRVGEAAVDSVEQAAAQTKEIAEVPQRVAEVVAPKMAGRAGRVAASEAAKTPAGEEAAAH
jgi:hypothetical protein